MFNFQLFDDTGSTKRRFTGGREREQICRQVKVLSSQQRISPEGSQTDSQPKLEGQIYTQLSRNKLAQCLFLLNCIYIYIYIDEGVRPVAWQQCKHSLFDVREREGC